MASSSSSTAADIKVSYQRLKQETWFDEDEYKGLREKAMGRLRKSRLRRLHIRRPRIKPTTAARLKIPSLRRFLRRKARLVKLALNKVYRRLKESQLHFGDLFAGNYLFMQVTPTPLKYAAADHHHTNKSSSFANGGGHYHLPHRHHHDIPRINA